MVGAACITAILNANRTHEMPMYLVGAESLEHVKLALFKTKKFSLIVLWSFPPYRGCFRK